MLNWTIRIRSLMLLVGILISSTFGFAAEAPYASSAWWDGFWKTTDGWGKPNERVMSLFKSLDGSKKTITVVDIGSGNGRNSVLTLVELFATKDPESNYIIHCFDYSDLALLGLAGRTLPGWLEIVTVKADVNALTSIPNADLVLLYGILEYVEEQNLSRIFNVTSKAVNEGGFLVVVTLVDGEGALKISGEFTRSAEEYTRHLASISNLKFIDTPTVSLRPDRHDLGRGYAEDHLHYVFRTVLSSLFF